MQEPIIRVSPAFKGAITVADLLTTEGTLQFSIDRNSINEGGIIFQLINDDFVFVLSLQNNSIVFQRNKTVSVLTVQEILDKNYEVMVFAIWTHEILTLHCMAGEDSKRAEVPTIPTATPPQLIRWARKNSLIPVEKYSTEEELREKIHSCFLTINEKIREADASGSFVLFLPFFIFEALLFAFSFTYADKYQPTTVRITDKRMSKEPFTVSFINAKYIL